MGMHCDMQSVANANRDVVLAAVQQNGSALQYANKKLKSDREVVLTAVGNDGQSLEYVVPHLRTEILRNAIAAGVGETEYAHMVLYPLVVTVQSIERLQDGIMHVHVSTIGGDAADVDVNAGDTTAALRVPLAAAWGMPAGALRIVLQSGKVCTIGCEADLL